MLIDKNVLLKNLHDNLYCTDISVWDGGMCWIRYKDIENEIDNTEIVEERPKAKWSTIIQQKDWLITETRQCNRCSYEPPLEEVKNFRYCPWCGARME